MCPQYTGYLWWQTCGHLIVMPVFVVRLSFFPFTEMQHHCSNALPLIGTQILYMGMETTECSVKVMDPMNILVYYLLNLAREWNIRTGNQKAKTLHFAYCNNAIGSNSLGNTYRNEEGTFKKNVLHLPTIKMNCWKLFAVSSSKTSSFCHASEVTWGKLPYKQIYM